MLRFLVPFRFVHSAGESVRDQELAGKHLIQRRIESTSFDHLVYAVFIICMNRAGLCARERVRMCDLRRTRSRWLAKWSALQCQPLVSDRLNYAIFGSLLAVLKPLQTIVCLNWYDIANIDIRVDGTISCVSRELCRCIKQSLAEERRTR